MFPRVWKTARISPIPKIDQPIDKSDFRPVSILPALSKMNERLVLSQLASHIDEQSLLGVRISGYRQGHSTCTVLIGILLVPKETGTFQHSAASILNKLPLVPKETGTF